MTAASDRDRNSHDDAQVARRSLATGDRAATALLADPASRTIVRALGEERGARLSAEAIASRAPSGVSHRLVRDRVRELERAGILTAVDSTPVLQWALTPAGRDLHRLLSIVARIVVHAAEFDDGTPTAVRDRAMERTLRALGDPVVLRIAVCLSGGTALDPTTLERCCKPTPRRTLYRRLQPLVETGVVLRHTSAGVPRTTRYELADRWRPAAVLGMLPTWWNGRHRIATAARSSAMEIEMPLRVILPVVDVRRLPDGALVRWVVQDADSATTLNLRLSDGRLRADDAGPEHPADAEMAGSPVAWAMALVADQPGDIVIQGDAGLGRDALEAVRAALLSYVR